MILDCEKICALKRNIVRILGAMGARTRISKHQCRLF
jgi:hypothetical protein